MTPAETAPARLFLALWPDDATRAVLARCRDAWTWAPGARPQADAKLHVTLHFLGDVAAGAIAPLVDALPRSGAAFQLSLERASVWPNGVAVLEPEHDHPALEDLHQRVGAVLQARGIATEPRAFRPHVTLARRARRVRRHRSDAAPVAWVGRPLRAGAVAAGHRPLRGAPDLRLSGAGAAQAS